MTKLLKSQDLTWNCEHNDQYITEGLIWTTQVDNISFKIRYEEPKYIGTPWAKLSITEGDYEHFQQEIELPNFLSLEELKEYPEILVKAYNEIDKDMVVIEHSLYSSRSGKTRRESATVIIGQQHVSNNDYTCYIDFERENPLFSLIKSDRVHYNKKSDKDTSFSHSSVDHRAYKKVL